MDNRRQSERREMVHHPAHYGGDTTYEVVKVLEAWGLEADALLWNAVKYIARAPKQDDARLEDLKKARWYLSRRIERMESQVPSKAELMREEGLRTQAKPGDFDYNPQNAYQQIVAQVK